MKKHSWFLESLLTFIITLIVAVVVTLLWNLVSHGTPSIDWDTSFRLAIILGVALPIVNRAGRKG